MIDLEKEDQDKWGRRVFIAGPYTKPDQAENTRLAILAGHRLIAAGHFPFIPHLFHFMHFIIPADYEVWTRQDFEWLEMCEALIRLPGESAGADAEVERAKQLCIPVYYSVQEFFDAEKRRIHEEMCERGTQLGMSP